MNILGCMNKKDKKFTIMSKCKWGNEAKSNGSTESSGNKASHTKILSFEDCIPDINLFWILVIDKSGLDQQGIFI